jgi:hypothetical protein
MMLLSVSSIFYASNKFIHQHDNFYYNAVRNEERKEKEKSAKKNKNTVEEQI